MVIEVEREITKAEAREITNLLMNVRQLIKKPEKKLADMFTFCVTGAVCCALSLLVFCYFFARGDRDALVLSGFIITLVAVVFLVVFYLSVNKTYQALLKREREHVVITLDEKGIDYEVRGSRRYQVSWENVAFVRVFHETISFIPKDITGILVSIGKEHAEEIKTFLRENKIEVPVLD